MLQLFQGIWNYFSANTDSDFAKALLNSDGTYRFYFEYAEQTAIKPYVVYHDAGYDFDHYFTHDQHYHKIIINIWDDGRSNNSKPTSAFRTLQIGEYCKDLFDDARPTVTGWSVLGMLRTEDAQPPIMWDEERGEWCLPICYKIKMQQNT